MASITTIAVGLDSQPLAPAPVAGAAASVITVINLDTENTVNLGSSASQLALALGPLASVTLTAPVWAGAATEQLQVGIIPGGGGYSPGSLTITGPVTAEITGPVTVEGTVDIGGTTDVEIQNANIDVIGAGGYMVGGQVGTLYQNALTTITAGATATLASAVSVANYSSVVLSVTGATNSSTSAGAAICAVFRIAWFDGGSVFIAEDTVSTILSPAAGPDGSATWEIPVKGSSFTIFSPNVGTTGTITMVANVITVDGSYRVIPNTRTLQSTLPAAPTISGCTVELQTSPVYNVNSWIASVLFSWPGLVATYVFPLPQWCGEVAGWYQIITTALAHNATVVDLTYAVQGGVVSGLAYTAGIVFNIPSAIDTAPVPVTFNLPPTQCAVIIGTPATSGAFELSLVGVGN